MSFVIRHQDGYYTGAFQWGIQFALARGKGVRYPSLNRALEDLRWLADECGQSTGKFTVEEIKEHEAA